MFRKLFCLLGLSSLFLPANAQFGIGKKKGGSFQELNEKAKKRDNAPSAGGMGDLGALGDLGDLGDLFGDFDPKMMEELAGLGDQFEQIMDIMSKMSPEEMEKQMKDAMDMLSSGDMMESMLGMREEIIKTLEETGQVTADELAKMKTDPEYFEQKIKESFQEMADIFSNPETLAAATEGMKGLSDMINNPGDILDQILGALDSDEKIEEVRLQLLESPDLGIPGLSDAFNSPEMKAILNDPKKWRDSVKEGKGLLNGGAAGAMMGEL